MVDTGWRSGKNFTLDRKAELSIPSAVAYLHGSNLCFIQNFLVSFEMCCPVLF